jgi:hypothetical protein
MDTDGQGMLKLSIGEKLHRFFFFQKAGLNEEIEFYHRIFREAVEVSHVDDGKVFLKRGAKPSFRKASLKRHLTPLKARFDSSPGARFLPFGTFAGCFAMAGTNPSAHTFSLFSRSLRRT